MDNSKKLSEMLKQSGSPYFSKTENNKSSSLLATLQGISSKPNHSCTSYQNLNRTLADLRGYIAKALNLDEKDAETFEQRKEVAENELRFLFDLFEQIPELQKKLDAAKEQLNNLDSTYGRI